MSWLIAGEPAPKVEVRDGVATCGCGSEMAADKFYAHLIFFGWVKCSRCETVFMEGDS